MKTLFKLHETSYTCIFPDADYNSKVKIAKKQNSRYNMAD